MTRVRVLAALLLALGAGCGPDCDSYCKKLAQCSVELQNGVAVDVAKCTAGCNDSGASRGDTIQCYITHSCPDLKAGHCSVTGKPPG